MSGEADFAALYKKLLDSHYAPSPNRSAAVLAILLRELAGTGLPPGPPETGVENRRRL